MTLELNKWVESEIDDIIKVVREKRINIKELTVKTNGLKDIPLNDSLTIQKYKGWLDAIEYFLTKDEFNGGL